MKSWNPVLNKFIEIKEAFISTFGANSLYSYNPEEECCLEYWVRNLDIPEYIELIKPLQFTAYDEMLLIRYANFEKLFSLDDDPSAEKFDFDTFWDMNDGFYMECRSVVIDIYRDELILTPFRKFRNMDECEENSKENIKARIANAKSVEITNKLNGSMQSARCYKGIITMSGSQALDPKNSWRLEDGYIMLASSKSHKCMLHDNPHLTFIFEYISLKDAHVVKYDKSQEGLYLIGIRDVNTGREFSYKEIKEYAEKYDITMTEIFDTSFDEIIKTLGDKRSDEAEGFVLNIDGYKVKIKYDDYVKMHKLLSILSAPNLIIRSIADGNFDDFLSKVPEVHKEKVYKVSNLIFKYLNEMKNQIEEYYNQAPKTDRKTFMIWVDEHVPSLYNGYVKNEFIGQDYSLLKSKKGGYKKYADIQAYLNEFTKEEIEDDYDRD